MKLRARSNTAKAACPYNDPGQLPITPLRHPNGEWLRLEIALPGYSVWLRGWLGNVAGDQLKAASDLGVPVVGVGLLYQQGYFRQVIDGRDGAALRSRARGHTSGESVHHPHGGGRRL